MQKRLILDSHQLEITVNRLCQQLIENHGNFSDSVIIGLQPRGIYLAELIKTRLFNNLSIEVPLGYLDTTFHRDDFRRRKKPREPSTTNIKFIIEDKNVILVDDVIYTGRSIRAAMDAMITFGRPRKVELLTLINRKYSRQLPIEPDYVGRDVNTIKTQRVLVEWKVQGNKEDKIWLITEEIS